ncbi:hypothetical protein F5Y18DRAFT_44738 [Xylariaceae sp. FL1019]|nr:hypothetical protein F5Y18DRAFT_44738 [Xylariaceae sp. FL1019]
MPDKPPPLPAAQTSTPSQAAALSPKSAPLTFSHVAHKTQAPAEEEPYTIKCICDFIDDDGNTIYCDKCDSWQHIECYYPFNMDEVTLEDFYHFCVDCSPRPLDRQRAKERQFLRQNKLALASAPERKPTKRPPPKGQRKKAKPADLAASSHSGSENNTKASQDALHTYQHKKSKSTHRPSQSISSQAAKRSPSYGTRPTNPHGHPPSPATTPPDISAASFEIHTYSDEFMNLYKDDRDVAIVQTNSFASLIISNLLSTWLRDGEKLRKETGCDYGDVFQSLPSDIESRRASPQVRSKKLALGPDTVIHWQYLVTPEAVDKDIPLIELNGQIGIQKDYCQDPSNRWADLSSPLPFVFFHPELPLYIDTRKEGSLARYVRRSCKPNATFDTFLSEGSVYHFWLVSDRPLKPNEQITIPWVFNLQKDVARRWLQLLGLSDDGDKQPDFNANDVETYQSIATWVHTILSEYGGCACELGPDCAFSRFHRSYIFRSRAKERGSRKKSRKSKSNVSPTSTGQATNSRAPSEGHLDDGADNDSGSSRSKPPSRDPTPAPRQGSFDTLGVLTELTDRDKRKVQMVEDSFRRMEQQQQPPRKKKRVSDGTNASNSSTTKTKSKGAATKDGSNASSERLYIDAGTSGSIDESSTSAMSPSTVNLFRLPVQRQSAFPSRKMSADSRPEYCDAAVQTDFVDGAWFSNDRQIFKSRKRVVSLSKRLLASRRRFRNEEIERRRSEVGSPNSVTSALVKMDLESPVTTQCPADIRAPEVDSAEKAHSIPTEVDTISDMPMADDPSVPESHDQKATISLPAANAKVKSPELRVQLPPVPVFSNTSAGASVSTPLSANGTITQSPFSASNNLSSPFAPPSLNGTIAQPSPVKKKLSLSDYTKSRMNKVAAAKSIASPLKPSTAIIDEAKSPINTDVVMTDSADS